MADLDGRALLAQGVEAEIYEWGDGRVLRLMRSPEQRDTMQRSTAAIGAARAVGVPTPAVLEEVEVDGRPGQVMERVDGIDQFALLAGRPWRIPSTAQSLGRAHAHVHRTAAPAELPSVHHLLRIRVLESPLVPGGLADAALAALEDLPSGTALCHGDFHPGNVLVTDDDPVLIDWSNAGRGNAMADVARTRLMLGVGRLPPGSPLLVRLLTPAARAGFARSYLRAYAAAAEVDRPLVDRWMPVRAVGRLTEDIDGERPQLLAIARRGLGLDD